MKKIELYKLDAVHPIFKRVIKFKLTKEKVTELKNELLEAGYEKQNIEIRREDGKT